ncbi:septal ring lytic transglycosylase RlpA family protein [Leptothrix sp. BB-4]
MHPPVERANARPNLALFASLAALLWLAACSTTPPARSPQGGAGRPAAPAPVPPLASWDGSRDGAEANPPPNLHLVPDAEPKVEPLRQGGPNKPYEVDGITYRPMTADEPAIERGLASWYGRKFHGRRTASGELYNMYAMTAAHPTFAIPSYARVRNPANGREVIVRINDRGPFKGGRVIDLSYTAALKLGLLGGVAPVEVERLTHEAIRTGSWRRDDDAATLAQADPAPAETTPPQRVAPAAPATIGRVAAPQTSESRSLAPVPTPVPVSVPTPLVVPTIESSAAAEWNTQPSPAATRAAPPEVMPQERAGTQAARGWWLQLGAFKAADGAAQFQRKLSGEADWLAPLLTLFREQSLNKLQAGPFPSKAEAQAAAERLRSQLQLVPMLVERR